MDPEIYRRIDEDFNRVLRRTSDIDPIAGDPSAVLARIVQETEAATDDELGVIAILLIEPLLDTHWASIAGAFGEEMRLHRRLRMAYSSAVTSEVPESITTCLEQYVLPDEYIGREPYANPE
jgi:hypothetical protein